MSFFRTHKKKYGIKEALLLGLLVLSVGLIYQIEKRPDSTSSQQNPLLGKTKAQKHAGKDKQAALGNPQPAALAPRWVWGKVVDPQGKAIAGAEVFLFVYAGRYRLPRLHDSTTTSVSGAFEFHGIARPNDLYAYIQIRKDGYLIAGSPGVSDQMAAWYQYYLWHNDPLAIDARHAKSMGMVTLSPGTLVHGNVIVPQGCSITKTLVHALDSNFSLGWPVGEDGKFKAWVSPHVGLGAVLEKYWGIEFQQAAGDPIEIILKPSAVKLTVVDPSGKAIEGALVRQKNLLFAPQATNSDGVARIVTRFGQINIGHPDYQEQPLILSHGSKSSTITMEPARWLTCYLDPSLAKPPILISSEFPLGLERIGDRYRSIGLKPHGGYNFLLYKNLLPTIIRWPMGTGEHDLGRIAFKPGMTLAIKVVDDRGIPIVKASTLNLALSARYETPFQIVLDQETFFTNSSGIINMAGLRKGVYKIAVEKSGYISSEVSVEVSKVLQTVQMVLPRMSHLLFTIRSHGKCLEEFDPLPYWQTVDRNDHPCDQYNLHIAPNIAYDLYLQPPGHLEFTMEVPPLQPGERLDLGQIDFGKIPEQRAKPPSTKPIPPKVLVTYEGFILDNAGSPISDISIYLRNQSKNNRYFSATTNDFGEFFINDIPDGQWNIQVKTNSGGSDHIHRITCYDKVFNSVAELPPTITLALPPRVVVKFIGFQSKGSFSKKIDMLSQGTAISSANISDNIGLFYCKNGGQANVYFRSQDNLWQSAEYNINLPEQSSEVQLVVEMKNVGEDKLTALDIQVIDGEEQPISGAEILSTSNLLLAPDGTYLEKAATNADGRVVVHVKKVIPSDLEVWMNRIQWGAQKEVLASENKIKIVASPLGIVTLNFVDASTGKSIDIDPGYTITTTDDEVSNYEDFWIPSTIFPLELPAGKHTLLIKWFGTRILSSEIQVQAGKIQVASIKIPAKIEVYGYVPIDPGQAHGKDFINWTIPSSGESLSMKVDRYGRYEGALGIPGLYRLEHKGNLQTVMVKDSGRYDINPAPPATGQIVASLTSLQKTEKRLTLTSVANQQTCAIEDDGSFKVPTLAAGEIFWSVLRSELSPITGSFHHTIGTDINIHLTAIAEIKLVASGSDLLTRNLRYSIHLIQNGLGRRKVGKNYFDPWSANTLAIPVEPCTIIAESETGDYFASTAVRPIEGVQTVDLHFVPGGKISMASYIGDVYNGSFVQIRTLSGSPAVDYRRRLADFPAIVPVGTYQIQVELFGGGRYLTTVEVQRNETAEIK